jgi:hypothetical protein
MSAIRISAKVAYDLVKQSARLFYQGTGIVLAPMDETGHMERGFIDEMPEGSDMRYWANLLLHFARTVHGLFEYELLEQDLLDGE